MPSRKYGLSDGSSSSHKSSPLRRLSSLASFNTLNPFNRRRSNNTTAESNAASSTTNLSSPTTIPHESSEHNESRIVSEPAEDEVSELPQHPHRRSYICLPDEPVSGMPRSRTFSNLPLPTRAYRTNRDVPARDQRRLATQQLSSTRLPSPTGSTRKYSSTRFASGPVNAQSRQPLLKGRMKRSDTEPLLPVYSSTGRSTAFKENISPGPARPLPSDLASHIERPINTVRPRNREYAVYRPASNASQALHSDSSGLPSSPQQDFLVADRGLKSHSSPLKQIQGSPEDATLKTAEVRSMQRWNSQPVLTSISHNVDRRVVQQNRLLSVRQPPTPEPAKQLALSLSAASAQRSDIAGQITAASTDNKENIEPTTPEKASHLIVTAMPMPYWCGRFSALNDRYRNEELAEIVQKKRTESDNMHSTEATLKRMRRVLEHLHSCCTTVEAYTSFVTFQCTLAAIEKMPALAQPVGDKMQGAGADVTSPSSRGQGIRKTSFIDRLLARASKSRKSVG